MPFLPLGPLLCPHNEVAGASVVNECSVVFLCCLVLCHTFARLLHWYINFLLDSLVLFVQLFIVGMV